MKLLVTINKKEQLNKLLSTKVDGLIIGIDGLSVNTNFSCVKEDIIPLLNKNKEIYLLINKMIHNKDLTLLEEVMTYFKDKDVRIIFYDLAVLHIADKLNMIDKLVIKQNHLNNSIMSNNFYQSLGVKNTILSSDITLDEIFEIKDNTKMNIYITAYGYIPIFHSKRKLISSYLEYIKKEKEDDLYYILDKENKYPIMENDIGTTVYTHKKINYLDECFLLQEHKIDYLILDSIYEDDIISVLEEYINAKENKKIEEKDRYKGFLYTKTIYKVKKNDK